MSHGYFVLCVTISSSRLYLVIDAVCRQGVNFSHLVVLMALPNQSQQVIPQLHQVTPVLLMSHCSWLAINYGRVLLAVLHQVH